MYRQKLKTGLRFIGILLFRILIGIVVGHLWVVVVGGFFHFTGENVVSQHAEIGPPNGFFDYFDSKYDTDNPVFRIVAWVAFIGYLGSMALGLFWGFCQGRLDFRRWLRKRYA